MKLEAPPVHVDVEFILQPDQAGPLSDIAEGSDEVGIDQHLSTHFSLRGSMTPLLRVVNLWAQRNLEREPLGHIVSDCQSLLPTTN
jgi:hypothetical protein